MHAHTHPYAQSRARARARARACAHTHTHKTKDVTDLNVILGGLVGAVAAACVALLLFYVQKRPKQAIKAC